MKKNKVTFEEGLCCDCRFLSEWHENQAPLGSGYVWNEDFSECGFEGAKESEALSKEDWDNWQEDWGLDENNKCPYWKGLQIETCPKHGEYIAKYGCNDCEAEQWEESERLRKEWGQGDADRD